MVRAESSTDPSSSQVALYEPVYQDYQEFRNRLYP